MKKIIGNWGRLVQAWQRGHESIIKHNIPFKRFVITTAQIQTNLNTVSDLVIAMWDNMV